jgi:hypothetical protein
MCWGSMVVLWRYGSAVRFAISRHHSHWGIGSMTTTLQRVKGGCDANIAAQAAMLTDQTLERRDILPRAANNKPMACSSVYAERVRKDMADGRSQEHQRLLAVDLCDVRDGVPVELVLMPRLRHIAIVKAALAQSAANHQLRALQITEMKFEHALNLAQRELDERPDDPAANARVVRAITAYLPKLLDLRAECERRSVASTVRTICPLTVAVRWSARS